MKFFTTFVLIAVGLGARYGLAFLAYKGLCLVFPALGPVLLALIVFDAVIKLLALGQLLILNFFSGQYREYA